MENVVSFKSDFVLFTFFLFFLPIFRYIFPQFSIIFVVNMVNGYSWPAKCSSNERMSVTTMAKSALMNSLNIFQFYD